MKWSDTHGAANRAVYWGRLGDWLIGYHGRTPILSGEADRGPRSVYPEESLDKLSAHRERAEPGLGRTGKYAPYAVVLPPFIG